MSSTNREKFLREQLRNLGDPQRNVSNNFVPLAENEKSAEEIYKENTNAHRQQIFDLIIAEVRTKSELREKTYKKLWRIFWGQLIGSILFLAISVFINSQYQKQIVSDKLLIAIVVTLTGSFLSFLGVAHKYIFSSSKELFDYANEISWSDIDETHE